MCGGFVVCRDARRESNWLKITDSVDFMLNWDTAYRLFVGQAVLREEDREHHCSNPKAHFSSSGHDDDDDDNRLVCAVSDG